MVLTFGFAYLFFKSAESKGLSPVHWAFAGAIAYQLPAWGWMLVISRPYMASIQGMANKTSASTAMMGHSWLLFGIVCAVIVYKFFLMNAKKPAE